MIIRLTPLVGAVIVIPFNGIVTYSDSACGRIGSIQSKYRALHLGDRPTEARGNQVGANCARQKIANGNIMKASQLG